MRSRAVLLMVGVLLGFTPMTVAHAGGPGVEIGPQRQVLPRHGTVEVYVLNYGDPTPLRVHVTTVAGDTSTGSVQFASKELPLDIQPSVFTLKNKVQRTITVRQTGPIADPMVGLSFNFEPVQSVGGTGVTLSASIVAELVTHPEAAIFQPPPPAPEHRTPWYWWLVPLAAVLTVSVWRAYTRHAPLPKKPKKSAAKVTGF